MRCLFVSNNCNWRTRKLNNQIHYKKEKSYQNVHTHMIVGGKTHEHKQLINNTWYLMNTQIYFPKKEHIN